jgi:hypothetical protein
LRHRSLYLEPIESRKESVVPREHTPQAPFTFVLIIEAPVYSLKGARYDSHEVLSGGVTGRTSISEHVTGLLAMPALIIADERYVRGETRYMNIQKRGRSDALTRTLTALNQLKFPLMRRSDGELTRRRSGLDSRATAQSPQPSAHAPCQLPASLRKSA